MKTELTDCECDALSEKRPTEARVFVYSVPSWRHCFWEVLGGVVWLKEVYP